MALGVEVCFFFGAHSLVENNNVRVGVLERSIRFDNKAWCWESSGHQSSAESLEHLDCRIKPLAPCSLACGDDSEGFALTARGVLPEVVVTAKGNEVGV